MVTGLPEGKEANRKPQDLHLRCHSESKWHTEVGSVLIPVSCGRSAASEKLLLSTDIHIETQDG